jgi:hypothetical protein
VHRSICAPSLTRSDWYGADGRPLRSATTGCSSRAIVRARMLAQHLSIGSTGKSRNCRGVDGVRPTIEAQGALILKAYMQMPEE